MTLTPYRWIFNSHSVRVGFLTGRTLLPFYANSARRQLLPFYVNFRLVTFTNLPPKKPKFFYRRATRAVGQATAAKRRVPRLSVRASAASLCSAVVLPLVEQTEELRQQATARWRERSDLFGSDSDDDDALVDELCAGRRWVADCTKAAPVLVPLLSLGQRMDAYASAQGEPEGAFSLAAAEEPAGGQPLHALCLEPMLFEAAVMQSGVGKDLMAMTVAELKEELAARDEAVSGNKAWLRRRLHAAIVREYLDAE